MKLARFKSALNPRWFILLTVLRRWSRCYFLLLYGLFFEAIGLALFFVVVFFCCCCCCCCCCPCVFSAYCILITTLREERANLSAFSTFVTFCLFPLPLGVWEGLRIVIVALPGLFSYRFLDQVHFNK